MRATETATDVSILPREMSRSDRGVQDREVLSVSPELLTQAQKKRPGNTPRPLNNVRATETATDVSILPREMSRSDRGVQDREVLSVSPELLTQAQKKRPGNTPRPLNNVRATETATDVSVLPREMSRSDRGVRNREALSDCPELLPQATKKRPRNTPRSLKNVRATETATDVSVLPREMSRSDRGVRDREVLSVSPELLPQTQKNETGEHSSTS